MSRIGKLPIPVPDGVEVALETGNRLSVTGSRGTLQRTFAPSMLINVETGTITVDRPSNARIHRSLHGLTRTLVANMVQGVSGGFTRDLDLVGVGFRAARQGGDLILTLGYSHPIRYTPPEGINIEVPGADADLDQRLGQGGGRAGGRQDSILPQARAVQGEGHPVSGREAPPQGRQVRQGRQDQVTERVHKIEG